MSTNYKKLTDKELEELIERLEKNGELDKYKFEGNCIDITALMYDFAFSERERKTYDQLIHGIIKP